MVSRRTFLKGLAAGAAALVLPPTLTDNADAARRFWALDSTMLGQGDRYTVYIGQSYNPFVTTHVAAATEYRSVFADWVEAKEPGGMVWWGQQQSAESHLLPDRRLTIRDLEELIGDMYARHGSVGRA